MPQEWMEHWPLPDGSQGLDALQLSTAEDDDSRAIATRLRHESVQAMGNLTILTQELNSAQSHSAWKNKKPALMKHSLLSINQDLHDVMVWDESAITSRDEKLFDRALGIWTRNQPALGK